MPADSITIIYHDTAYTFSVADGPPPGLDTTQAFREVVINQRAAIKQNDNEDAFIWAIFLFIIALVFVARSFGRSVWSKTSEVQPIHLPHRSYHIIKGSRIHFERHTLHKVLTRYFIYYRNLCHQEQNRFINRLEVFINSKTFIIPAAEAYREMPILISASAIQLTFGLKDFLLPWFENICVHPNEYVLDNPIRTLAGNVSGNTITLSWKHFLNDYQRQDGVNVGLHEMAHALQMQCEYFYKRKGRDFRMAYNLFETIDNHVRALERTNQQPFYSAYALTNTDEFWACSVELFFERPAQLQTLYPQVYDVLKSLLRQDLTRSEINPCIAF